MDTKVFDEISKTPRELIREDNFKNLTTARYKTCGFGYPYYDQDGHYDEVKCLKSKDFCGEATCPLDRGG